MRFLTWLISLPIPIVVLIFALQNREQVELSFWPFDVQIAMPLSFLAVGLVAVGFVVGVLLLQFTVFKLWRKNRKAEKTIKKLQAELTKQKAETVKATEPTIIHQDQFHLISDTRERKI